MPAGAEPEEAADGGSVAAFEAYARDGQRRLYRTAYLLCGNVEGAKDLTQTTLAKLFQHWRRASRADNLDAYAKTVLVRTYVAERRRSVRDLLAHRSNTPRPQADPASGVDLRVTLLALLDELPPRARAMVVLRYWEGERRRVRSRGLAVAGTFVAVTAVTLGLALLGPLLRQTPGTEPAAPAPGPSITRPTPAPSPDPTEPVTGMPIPAPSSPPTATPPPSPSSSFPLWSPPPSPPSTTPPAARTATPYPGAAS